MTTPSEAIDAQAHIHHQFFLGLQLLVAVETSKQTVFDWMFQLFRRQHEEKFLSSFEKLGLSDLPHAVACAKYHVLSNSMGGVGVEYMYENDEKAWVRFRYPRWMYSGPAICGVPVEASRGFLHGWYAQNGVSLQNPKLGFVCVSEDMTSQFGLCGYFKEYDHMLSADQRLVFSPDERPPAYDASAQPVPPASEWNEERLAKANRNYALEYVRNGIRALSDVIGRKRTLELGMRAARLTGLQQYPAMARAIGAKDDGPAGSAAFMKSVMFGMGDAAEINQSEDGQVQIIQSGLRIVRGIDGSLREDILSCWIELWRGMIHSQRDFMDVSCERKSEQLIWTISHSA